MFLDTARGPAIAAVDGDFFVVGILDAVSVVLWQPRESMADSASVPWS